MFERLPKPSVFSGCDCCSGSSSLKSLRKAGRLAAERQKQTCGGETRTPGRAGMGLRAVTAKGRLASLGGR